MADHYKIFIALVNLMAGSAIFIYTQNVQKAFSFPYIKHVKHYIVYYNILIFLLLVTKYYDVNVSLEGLSGYVPAMVKVVDLVFSLTFIGMAFAVFSFYNGIRGNKVKQRIITIIRIFVLFTICSYFIYIFITPQSAVYKWISIVLESIGDLFFILQLVVMTAILLYSRRVENPLEAKMVRFYPVLYFIGFVSFFILYLLPAGFRLYLLFPLLFYCNIIPVIWLRFYFLRFANDSLVIVADKGLRNTIFNKYNISKREQEIIELLLEGNSNKEITQKLFISLHTVKNHIYNIYQKMGIKSRYQLLNVFIQK